MNIFRFLPVLALACASVLANGTSLRAQPSPKEYETARQQFLDRLFAETPTPARLEIKNNVKRLIERELASLRFGHRALPAVNASARDMLAQLNAQAPLPADSAARVQRLEQLERFKQAHLRRLLDPWKTLQRKLDDNPKLCVYAFRPTPDALYTRKRFIISRPGTPLRTAGFRAIVQTLFALRGPDAPRCAWSAEPAQIRLEGRKAILWFPSASRPGEGLLLRADYAAHIIWADVSSAP